MGKQPHVEMEDRRSTTSTRNTSTYQEGPTLTIGDGSKSPKTAEQTILNMEPR